MMIGSGLLELHAFIRFPEATETETGVFLCEFGIGICENDLNLAAPTAEAEDLTGDTPVLLSASLAPSNLRAKVLANIFSE